MSCKKSFFRRLDTIMRVFWLAIVADTAYILYYIRTCMAAPVAAMLRGETLSAVPLMVEHILMSATLLLLCACMAEILRRDM